MNKALFASVALALTLSGAFAQDANSLVKIDPKGIQLEQQPTPQIQASNIVDKKWRPKNWLELDAKFDIKLPRDAGGRDGSLGGLEVKYYITTNARDKDGKVIGMSGSVRYQNVPADDEAHVLAFIAPSTLKRLLQKDNAGKADITFFGCEFIVAGQIVSFVSSNNNPWWYSDPAARTITDKVVFEDGAVLGKNKTPFAPFWGDYDVPVAAQ